MRESSIKTRARANVALVKYFGKRDLALNLPAAGSLSLALDPLVTVTELTLDPGMTRDAVSVGGDVADVGFHRRVVAFLDLVRHLAGKEIYARVETHNTFPTAAGLASSASGFAALALAATRAFGLDLTLDALSALARQGSGSAARSVTGGISVWQAGKQPDGSDSFARSIADPGQWDLRVIIGVSDPGPKSIGSTAAMEQTRTSSPYYDRWITLADQDLARAQQAVIKRDFEALGDIAEGSALAMHAAALAARPGIVFWNGVTVEALHRIRALRLAGHGVYFTCDAGPQPKALCLPNAEDAVAEMLEALPGIHRVIRCGLGPGVEVVS
ncbi:MAG: diphosphomevalonate decarboxylase [Myxococcota bacterium]|nr:diphosphomevalonate decarboxylase [Myxococcota bacterium]